MSALIVVVLDIPQNIIRFGWNLIPTFFFFEVTVRDVSFGRGCRNACTHIAINKIMTSVKWFISVSIYECMLAVVRIAFLIS